MEGLVWTEYVMGSCPSRRLFEVWLGISVPLRTRGGLVELIMVLSGLGKLHQGKQRDLTVCVFQVSWG